MANEQKRQCKQVYINGKPYDFYDETAHESIDEIERTLRSQGESLSNAGSKLSYLNDDGQYVGSLKYGIPTEDNTLVDLDGNPITNSYTSVEGSGIPYFYLDEQQSTLHIKFR